MFQTKAVQLTKTFLISSIIAATSTYLHAEVKIGTDLNSTDSVNTDIADIYSANRGENGGGDQSLQFGDIIEGTSSNDVLIGGLGIDVLIGGEGDDVLIGGTEDFNSANRDRAFGQEGDDSFLWAPGDGNDFFDGGPGVDVLFMTLVGETSGSQVLNKGSSGGPFFGVSLPGNPGTGDFDGIFIAENGLPVLSLDNTPGFCELVEKDLQNQAGLDELGLDHLVRFVIRGIRENFENPEGSVSSESVELADDGLRVAVHLKNVEFVVCEEKGSSNAVVLDLTTVPAQVVDASQLPAVASQLLLSNPTPI